MRLKVLLPSQILLDEEVTKVTAEAEDGCFCLLPRHVDFATALVPGLLAFEMGRREEFLAIDEGVLVKAGEEVLVSTRRAVRGADLGELERTIAEQFRVLDEREKAARAVSSKLEANLVRRFMELS